MLQMHALIELSAQHMQNRAHATISGGVLLCKCAVIDPPAQAIARRAQRPVAHLEALVHVLHDLDGVVAIGQNVQQVS